MTNKDQGLSAVEYNMKMGQLEALEVIIPAIERIGGGCGQFIFRANRSLEKSGIPWRFVGNEQYNLWPPVIVTVIEAKEMDGIRDGQTTHSKKSNPEKS